MSEDKDVQSDYEYAREYYYSLADQGKEAIELMMDLVKETESPRAFEVLSTLMKQSSEITEKLMDLQKKKKDVTVSREVANPALSDGSAATTNNIFVGSTTELQKFLQLNKEEKDVTPDTDVK